MNEMTPEAVERAIQHGEMIYQVGLQGLDFSGRDLSGGSFVEVDLTGARLSDCNLHETRFSDCCLRGSDFSGNRLEETLFNQCVIDRKSVV